VWVGVGAYVSECMGRQVWVLASMLYVYVRIFS